MNLRLAQARPALQQPVSLFLDAVAALRVRGTAARGVLRLRMRNEWLKARVRGCCLDELVDAGTCIFAISARRGALVMIETSGRVTAISFGALEALGVRQNPGTIFALAGVDLSDACSTASRFGAALCDHLARHFGWPSDMSAIGRFQTVPMPDCAHSWFTTTF